MSLSSVQSTLPSHTVHNVYCHHQTNLYLNASIRVYMCPLSVVLQTNKKLFKNEGILIKKISNQWREAVAINPIPNQGWNQCITLSLPIRNQHRVHQQRIASVTCLVIMQRTEIKKNHQVPARSQYHSLLVLLDILLISGIELGERNKLSF